MTIDNANTQTRRSTAQHPLQVTVSVVIVNYNSREMVIDCLESLLGEQSEYVKLAVHVCDNCSPDQSADKIESAIIEKRWTDWVNLSRLDRNAGFAAGNNAALKELNRTDKPDYIWLLNADTVVRPGALGALVSYMNDNPRVGITGSRLEDFDGSVQACAFRFHTPASEFIDNVGSKLPGSLFERYRVAPAMPDAPCPVDWVSGASMLIRSEALEEVGLFDETYFLYYEETDLCRRMRNHAWQIHHVPKSRVVHLVGQSTSVTKRDQRPQRRPSYWFRSRRHYFIKHHGRLQAFTADLALAAGIMLHHLKVLIRRSANPFPPYFLYDLLRHSPVFYKAGSSTTRQSKPTEA